MISLTNHDFQWGRSEVVIIYPEPWWITVFPEENLGESPLDRPSVASRRRHLASSPPAPNDDWGGIHWKLDDLPTKTVEMVIKW